MPNRKLAHRAPCLWLLTDPRAEHGLMAAVARLPRGAGIILRHGQLPEDARRRLGEALLREARRRGLWLVAVDPPAGLAVDGVHLTSRHRRRPRRRGRRGLVTAAAHNLREAARARALGATLLLLSPVFATRSHAGARPLGPLRFAALVRATRLPVIALGGMDGSRMHRLKPMGAAGYAGIDCWMGPSARTQKASAPPI